MVLVPAARVRGNWLELSTVNAVLFREICETTTGFDPELFSLILLSPDLPTFTDPNSMLVGETEKPLTALEPRFEVSNVLVLPQPAIPTARASPNKGTRYRKAERAAHPADASVKEEEEAMEPQSARCGTWRQLDVGRINLNIFNPSKKATMAKTLFALRSGQLERDRVPSKFVQGKERVLCDSGH